MPASSHPLRIACLQPSATAILASIGELDRVVACTKYCVDVVPQLRDSPEREGTRNSEENQKHRPLMIVADSWTSKSAEILASHPDLVIAAVPYQESAVIEILKAGIRFLGLAPRSLNDIYSDIAIIAGAVGANDRGAQVISDMRTALEAVRRRTGSWPRKRVFCEEWGKPIIASQPWVAELIEAAGGTFLGSPGAHYAAIDVALMNPDVIIASWCGAGDRVPLNKIIETRGWSSTVAARNGQVYCISDELLNTPAPTLVAGLHALAAAINPHIIPAPARLRRIKSALQCSREEIVEGNQIDLG